MTVHALDAHDHHFHCLRNGTGCMAPGVKGEGDFFLSPKMKKEMQDDAHDDKLVDLSDNLNQLVKETASKRNDKNLRIAITSKGLVWIWTNRDNDYSSMDSELKSLDDNALLEIFGFQQSAS